MRTGSILNVHCHRRFVNERVVKDREVMSGRNAASVANTRRGKQYVIDLSVHFGRPVWIMHVTR